MTSLFNQKLVDPKSTKVDLNWNSPNPNQTDQQCYLTQNMTQPILNPTRTQTNDPFARFSCCPNGSPRRKVQHLI